MRAVVLMGMLTIIAGLAPVALAGYRLATHHVWALSSLVFLAATIVMVAAMIRTPEYRAGWAEEVEVTRTGQRPRWLTLIEGAAYVLLCLAVVLIPIAILLGVVPDAEAPLYVTVVVLVLLSAAWTLLELVLAPRHPAGT